MRIQIKSKTQNTFGRSWLNLPTQFRVHPLPNLTNFTFMVNFIFELPGILPHSYINFTLP